jgi:hypothetical protein
MIQSLPRAAGCYVTTTQFLRELREAMRQRANIIDGPGQEGAIAGRARARGEERADRLRVEGEAGPKLKQQRAELAAEARHLLEKCIERRVCPRQAEGVRDLLWRLDGKGETIRRGGRPALVGRSPVRPTEGHHVS